MGATTFLTVAFGHDPQDAFRAAREEALHRHGHDGYTGSIAEKRDFFMATAPARVDPLMYARWALEFDGPPPVDGWRKTPAQIAQERAEAERAWKADLRRRKIPERLWKDLAKLHRDVDDKWGPSGCIEITGAKATELRRRYGLAGKRRRAFCFFGWASK